LKSATLKGTLSKSAKNRKSSLYGTMGAITLAELMGGAQRAKKNTWGTLIGNWVPHNVRDQVLGFCPALVGEGRDRRRRFVQCLGVTASKFYGGSATVASTV
jgi:hypothetical protein